MPVPGLFDPGMLAKIAGLLPTHTRRSQESQTLQQFSTPIALGLAASVAAAITPARGVDGVNLEDMLGQIEAIGP